jgi:hypothetical protein
MHDREREREHPDITKEPESKPANFVLETIYKGERHVVAQGTAFTDPEQVVINWRGNSSVELIDSVDDLYAKFGNSPRVMWLHESGQLTEAEPDYLLESAETESQ